MTIKFFFMNVFIGLTKRKKLKVFLKHLFLKSNRNLSSLNFIFCTDKYLLKINKEFLGHDSLTDVITFNLAEDSININAEIYISVERVKENALHNGVPATLELHRVIFHGVLHLCGYGDKTASEKVKMIKAENECLSEYLQV